MPVLFIVTRFFARKINGPAPLPDEQALSVREKEQALTEKINQSYNINHYELQTIIYPSSVFISSASCGRSEQGAQELLPVKVRTEKIMPSGANATSFYSGTVEEENTSALSFSVMGTVKTVNASIGMPVRKGQLLATVDETAIRSSYNAAKASLAQAEDAYERMKKVYDKGSLPEIKWIEIQSKLQQARSMEEMARKNLSDCKLYAPFSGVVSGKEIEIGQNVTPGVPVIHIVSGKMRM